MLYSAESQGQVAVWGEEKGEWHTPSALTHTHTHTHTHTGCWQLRSRIKAVEVTSYWH